MKGTTSNLLNHFVDRFRSWHDRHAIDPIDPELVLEVKKGPDVVHENHAKLYHTSTRKNDGVILKACIKTLRLYKHVNEMKKDYR